jgi:hypothetical protein
MAKLNVHRHLWKASFRLRACMGPMNLQRQAIKMPTLARRWRHVTLLAFACVVPVFSPSAAPDENAFPPWERGAVTLGGYVAALNSSVSFGINGLAGLSVTPEDVLGLDSSLLVLGASGYYRLGESKRHQLSLSYSSYNRSASTTLTKEISIGDNVLLPGTHLDTEFNFAIARLSYTYAIFQDDRVRIGLGLGVYVAPVNIKVNVSNADDEFAAGKLQATLPLPAFSLQGELRLTPRFSLVGDINAMYLRLDEYQGSLLNTSFGAEYRLWKHFGLGLAFNVMSVHVEAQSSSNSYPGADFIGKVDVEYGGLCLYGKLAF